MNWLYQEDTYTPVRDRKLYIDRSILSILGTVSRIRHEEKGHWGGIYAVSPPAKFVCTLALIILLSLSRNIYFTAFADSCAILMASLLVMSDLKRIAAVTSVVILFSFILLLPSMLMGNIHNSIMICMKIAGSVLLLNILSHSTKWINITRSLKLIRIPDIIILIIDITMKYIVILGNFAVNMLYALRLRSVGKEEGKHRSISNILGVLFIKSKEMAEMTYHAMECRCFSGSYSTKMKFTFKARDFLYILFILFICAGFFLMRDVK